MTTVQCSLRKSEGKRNRVLSQSSKVRKFPEAIFKPSLDLARGFSAVDGRIDLESERVLSTDEGAEMGLERVL